MCGRLPNERLMPKKTSDFGKERRFDEISFPQYRFSRPQTFRRHGSRLATRATWPKSEHDQYLVDNLRPRKRSHEFKNGTAIAYKTVSEDIPRVARKNYLSNSPKAPVVMNYRSNFQRSDKSIR